MYWTLKYLHVTAAIVTISGFALRGWWMIAASPTLHNRVVRVAPHIVDTVFLLSGIGLIRALHLPVLEQPWLLAKLAALVAYVLLGTIALRRGRTRRIRIAAFVLALATFFYIGGVALSKSMMSWYALLPP